MKKSALPQIHLTLCAAAIFLQACTQAPDTRAYFQSATLNAQPAHLLLDTGSSATVLSGSAIHRLAIPVTPIPRGDRRTRGDLITGLSAPTPLSLGSDPVTAQFPLVHDSLPEDGLVGWPHIRDNLLFFDSAHRTITAAEKIPDPSAAWQQLPIHPFDVLLLEVTFPDGTTGNVLIDTGAPNGVSLSPNLWKQWRAAHPKAPSMERAYSGPSVGTGARLEAWADQVTVGNLTLTDVPVLQATTFESSWIPNYAGSLGLYALSRMELIADAKNNRAYLHPLPAPGPYYPGFHRPGIVAPASDSPSQKDWAVATNLRFNPEHTLLLSAYLKWNANDHAGAMADLDRAIVLHPDDTDAYLARAGNRLAEDDYDGAIADYTRILELNPKQPHAHIQRAIARQCRGDFAGALADYEQGMIDSPRDVASHPRIASEALRRRLGHPTPDFAQTAARWQEQWPKSLGLFIAGQLDEAALLAAAQKSPSQLRPGNKCSALYYIGVMRYLKGDTSGARTAWQQSLDTGAKNYFDYKFARTELARLAPRSRIDTSHFSLLFKPTSCYTDTIRRPPMNTPKLTIALLLALSLPLHAMDINPAFRGLGDYPIHPSFDGPQNDIPYSTKQSTTNIIINTISLPLTGTTSTGTLDSKKFPKPAFNPQTLKLNLDLPTFPQVNPAPLNQLLTPAIPTLVTPNTIRPTIPTTPPQKIIPASWSFVSS